MARLLGLDSVEGTPTAGRRELNIIPASAHCPSRFGPFGWFGSGALGVAFFPQRACAASFAIRVRSSAVIFVRRAFPPASAECHRVFVLRYCLLFGHVSYF